MEFKAEDFGIECRIGDFVTVVYRDGTDKRVQLRDWDGDPQQAIDFMEEGWIEASRMPAWAARVGA